MVRFFIVADPLLGPLQDNGGPAFTHQLQAGSPAIDAGDNALAVDADSNPLAFDQRGAGFNRILGGTVDIGAVEGVSGPSVAPELSTVVQFSTDGRAFSDDLSVSQGEEVVVRISYDNTGNAEATNAQAGITLPAGISLVADSTRTALTPAESEIVLNTDFGQSGAINESAVWSGSTLTISPQAGLYAQAVDATSGVLEIGKLRYINLHDIHYFNGAERFFVTADPDISGTNVSNTLDAAAAGAGTVGGHTLVGEELRSAAL